MNTEKVLQIAQVISEVLKLVKELNDKADIIVRVAKDDPEVWAAIKSHFESASQSLDEVLKRRNIQ